MTKTKNEDWERVGRLIIQRRIELGLETITALSAETGLSSRILGDLENARKTSYRPATLGKVEAALQWRPGSILASVAGNEPEQLPSITRRDLRDLALAQQDKLGVRGASSSALLDEIEDRLNELRRRYVVDVEAEIEEAKRAQHELEVATELMRDELAQEGSMEDYDLTADDGGGYDHQDEDEQREDTP